MTTHNGPEWRSAVAYLGTTVRRAGGPSRLTYRPFGPWAYRMRLGDHKMITQIFRYVRFCRVVGRRLCAAPSVSGPPIVRMIGSAVQDLPDRDSERSLRSRGDQRAGSERPARLLQVAD